MTKIFSEDEVHEYLYKVGLEKLVTDSHEAHFNEETNNQIEEFSLWKILKNKYISRIARIHLLVSNGKFIASKLKLPTDKTTPMELDLLGSHEEGLFVLELKVNRSAERNAFSELFAYSGYIAEMFSASGRRDITNVLVANLDVKITRQAFLYDLLIANRNTIVYKPNFTSDQVESLQLDLYLPPDEDFKSFTNELLAHDNMSCVVASFHDLDGWYDSKEENSSINQYTKEHLEKLSSHTAQLMEDEGLHGFCFIRKPWQERDLYYRNSIFICAINPYKSYNPERVQSIIDQIPEDFHPDIFETPTYGFHSRLVRLAQRSLKECLTYNQKCEVELPLWEAIVYSALEIGFTHNFAFRPTGMLREAYVSYLNNIYSQNEKDPDYEEDVSLLKVNEITNWLRAWMFMEGCGFTSENEEE